MTEHGFFHDISICAACGSFADGKHVKVIADRILSFCASCAIELGRRWLAERGPSASSG